MNPNVQIPEDRLLDPMLAEFVSKLSMDKPNWFFRLTKDKANYNGTLQGVRIADESKRYVRALDVIQDNRIAGTVLVELQYRYRSENRLNYVVVSNRIDNGRKGNKMATTKVDIAVRNAKKYFDPPRTGELLYDMMDDARDRLGRAVAGLKSHVANHHAFNSGRGIIAQQYLHAVLTGAPVNLQHETELRGAFCTTKYEEELSKFLLAQSMQNRIYKTVAIIEGDYCMFADDTVISCKDEAAKAAVLSLTFEQLPEDYQSKIAVLQLMQDNEVVLDVGYRLNDTVFLVIDDDAKT